MRDLGTVELDSVGALVVFKGVAQVGRLRALLLTERGHDLRVFNAGLDDGGVHAVDDGCLHCGRLPALEHLDLLDRREQTGAAARLAGALLVIQVDELQPPERRAAGHVAPAELPAQVHAVVRVGVSDECAHRSAEAVLHHAVAQARVLDLVGRGAHPLGIEGLNGRAIGPSVPLDPFCCGRDFAGHHARAVALPNQAREVQYFAGVDPVLRVVGVGAPPAAYRGGKFLRPFGAQAKRAVIGLRHQHQVRTNHAVKLGLHEPAGDAVFAD